MIDIVRKADQRSMQAMLFSKLLIVVEHSVETIAGYEILRFRTFGQVLLVLITQPVEGYNGIIAPGRLVDREVIVHRLRR